ncbi:hypothetical protein OQX61_21250 [Pedobacter sp. PLR]|uniref:hypothetical protein n=1 Tax=Pedobacter sp. PLR TaxID=2994465 RepID=UPI0022485054|nr:hypothetical protein [Pedobacter sp. PLR]MCX2453809.1 hypothetical protein [Pedobacter sp. PLR]
MKNVLLLFILLITSNINSKAADFDSLLVKSVIKELRIPMAKIKEEYIRTKPMPNDRTKTIVSIPVMAREDDDDYSFVMDAYILVVESGTGKILQKYHEKGYWESDAVRLDDIGIDTAPYRLNKDTRAFGITGQHVGHSGPNPYNEQTISLFVISGNSLIKVVDKLLLERYNGEWDMNCAGIFKNLKTIISVSPDKTNGYADLIINSKTITTETFKKGEECEEIIVQKKPHKSILKFNKESYPVKTAEIRY